MMRANCRQKKKFFLIKEVLSYYIQEQGASPLGLVMVSTQVVGIGRAPLPTKSKTPQRTNLRK